MGLEIFELENFLPLEPTGGGEVPYLGYVELQLEVPEIKAFKEDILALVLPNSRYGKLVPFTMGTIHIDRVLDTASEEELRKLSRTWQRGKVGGILAQKSATLKPSDIGGFSLDTVQGDVKLTQKIELQPFETRHVTGLSKVVGHELRVNVITEPNERYTSGAVMTKASLTMLKPGSSKVGCTLKNQTGRAVTIPARTPIAKLAAANVVPGMLAPKTRGKKSKGDQQKQAPRPKVSPEKLTELFAKLDLSGIAEWEPHHKQEVHQVIKDYAFLFALEDLDLGKTSVVKHSIKITDPTPFKERYRRIPPTQYEEVKKHLQEMLEIGAIRKSNSPWASAVVLVRKKDGSLRFCIDLRKLNARTVKDAYSLPRIDESLDCLNGSQIFTSLDLKSGYWQVELDEVSKPLTAFTVGPLGFYECQRMPFGLTNAPATFQRLMESCLGDMHLSWCIIYLDDIIIFSKTPEEHIKRLKGVFEKLAQAGLKLKPRKCELFKTKIAYLGHIVSAKGIETDPKKISAISQWPIPKTVTDVRSFLGFTNHYRRFIHQYAQIARPLHELTAGENANKKRKQINWTDDCNDAFLKLKKICSESPVLAYADYEKPFVVHTDASVKGLGAVLYQEQEEGKLKPIAFASRSLTNPERKYPVHKLEFLALKWAICERFHEYLYGATFQVFTDNNPLTYLLTTAKLDAAGHRWVAGLANYNFSLHYKPGKNNIVADALSRIPWPIDEKEFNNMSPEVVQAIIDACCVTEGSLMESFIGRNPDYMEGQELKDATKVISMKVASYVPEKKSQRDWMKEQGKDMAISKIKHLIQNKQLFKKRMTPQDPEELRTLLRHRQQFVIRNGLLFRKIKRVQKEDPTLQFVLPEKFREQAIKACHDDIGHLGFERSLDLMQDRFYWPNMRTQLESYIKNCDRCLKFKAKAQKEELNPIYTTHPMELVHMDYLTVEKGDKDVDVLVVTDHFTRFAQAFVTNNQKAPIVARTLWDKYFVYYGFPDKILSDQGRNFESQLIAELCKLGRVKKLRTTPYHPQSNGSCERFNQTLISMLGTLENEVKSKWPELVSTLVHAYNCTKSNATGYSPFYLMFGRQPRLPIDVEFGIKTQDPLGGTPQKYVERLQNRLTWAYAKAKEVNDKEIERNRRRNNRNLRCSKLEKGDHVLVRQKAFKTKHKIQDRWENTIYEILEKVDKNLPVYRVRNTEKESVERILHRNMLFPLVNRHESDLIGDVQEVKEDSDSDSDGYWSTDDQPTSHGPATRTRAKTRALVKANCLMEAYFTDKIASTNTESKKQMFLDYWFSWKDRLSKCLNGIY